MPQSTNKRTNAEDTAFLELVRLLDLELAERDGDDHLFYAQFNKPVGLSGVVLAYVDGDAIGCGAFKKHDQNTVEVKRMYVRPANRGQRIAAGILTNIEVWASEIGFSRCILETGLNQPEAIALYQRCGYEAMPNYGQYAGVKSSVCMCKSLKD